MGEELHYTVLVGNQTVSGLVGHGVNVKGQVVDVHGLVDEEAKVDLFFYV